MQKPDICLLCGNVGISRATTLVGVVREILTQQHVAVVQCGDRGGCGTEVALEIGACAFLSS
ncbi:hypothetical protein DMP23_46865 [Amycolatopsis sp. A1MSW2902]|uniref:hypothetical protein n=1 Tax=Amycolatopsis sp. A1MSW2902 TaxID=687413 RepID=UPI00307E2DBD